MKYEPDLIQTLSPHVIRPNSIKTRRFKTVLYVIVRQVYELTETPDM